MNASELGDQVVKETTEIHKTDLIPSPPVIIVSQEPERQDLLPLLLIVGLVVVVVAMNRRLVRLEGGA